MNPLFSPELIRNPYRMYAMMRQSQPVMYLEQLNIWSVFRYDDVRTVLSDYSNFSSAQGMAPQGAGRAQRTREGFGLINTDPPRHTMLRNLVNRAFTPKAVAALEPRIAKIAGELLDQVVATGRLDLVQDFSYPLPVIVIAELLGIPSEERDQFKHWSDEVVAGADNIFGGDNSASEQAHEEMNEYFRKVIAKRRLDPQDDLISALIFAEEENLHLSEHDILSFCALLLVAGNETTTNLIGNAVLTLLEHPDALAQLLANPQWQTTAIEEVLRYRSPVQAMFRTTVRDVEIGGQTIPQGQRVVAWIGSANRDEEKFAQADRFDMTRDPNPHIAFGYGVHFCLGAPLARLEARVALDAVFKRLPDLTRVDQKPLPPARGFIVHGVSSLPLQFTPTV